MAKDSIPQNPNQAQSPIAGLDEVSLENIDKILEDSDPGFAASLNEVRAASETTDVEIEPSNFDEKSLDPTQAQTQNLSFAAKVSGLLSSFRIRTRNFLILLGREFWIWLKVRPKEYLLYLLSQIKNIFGLIGLGFKKFGALSGAQKLAFFGIFIVGGGAIALIGYNLKGQWLPRIDQPLILDFTEVADKTWDVKNEKWVPLFQALRQPEHRYLFDRVIVNLKPIEGARETVPMGMFEFYVELDSKETAIEVNDRKQELTDVLQRTIEEETYTSLVGEPGKQRLKNLIRQEMNQVLNQGWVKEVFISNMVLKP